MTIGYFIQSVSSPGLSEGFERLDVELLLSKVLCCDRVYLYTHWHQELKREQIQQLHFLLNMRKTGMPVAYILGKKEFYGYEFIVKPGVFIPRPETETFISAIVSQWDRQEELKIMDFGCGSGCIGLSLLSYFPNAVLIAIDINKEAVKISEMNAHKLEVADRVVFLNKNISSLKGEDIKFHIGEEAVDLIVANPPYIAFDDGRIEKNVVSFEPPEALFSGEGGLYHIRSWWLAAAQFLKPRGAYFFEIGKAQEVSFMESEETLIKTAEFKDLSNIVRVLQFQKCNG